MHKSLNLEADGQRRSRRPHQVPLLSARIKNLRLQFPQDHENNRRLEICCLVQWVCAATFRWKGQNLAWTTWKLRYILLSAEHCLNTQPISLFSVAMTTVSPFFVTAWCYHASMDPNLAPWSIKPVLKEKEGWGLLCVPNKVSSVSVSHNDWKAQAQFVDI